MKIVVDTNILFSFFWKNSLTKKLILNSSLELYSPIYVTEEILKYKSEIIKKTNINNDSFDHYLNELKDSIQLIKRIDYSDFLVDAMLLSPDEKDADFFALCLKNSCPIWSNDLTLKKQEKIKVLTTKEIILLL